MPTQAIAAYGAALKIGATVIPEVTNLSEIGAMFGVIDVSAHDGNNWVSRIPTLLDGGTITVTANFVPGNSTHILLRTTMLARTSTAFTFALPPAGTPAWTFSAFVTRYRLAALGVTSALVLTVDLTVDGVLTFA